MLAEMSVICQNNPTSFIIAAGDFNSDFSRDTLQVNELKQFCIDQSLESCGFLPNSNINYTFECKKSGSRTLIDHVLISSNIRDHVKSCIPLDSVNNNSDHLAVRVELDVKCEYFSSKELSHKPKPAWYKVTIDDKDKYRNELDGQLNDII